MYLAAAGHCRKQGNNSLYCFERSYTVGKDPAVHTHIRWKRPPSTLSSPSLGANVKNMLSSMFAGCFYLLLLNEPRDGAAPPSPWGAVQQSHSVDCQERVFTVKCYSAFKNDYMKENLLISHTYSLGIRIVSIYFSDSDTLVLFLFLLPLQNRYS